MNATISNLRKASIAKTFYTNQTGQVTFHKPPEFSVNGTPVNDTDIALFHKDAPPNETTLARARRRGILDRWKLHVVFMFTGGQRIEYTGAEAEKLLNVYKGIVYKKDK